VYALDTITDAGRSVQKTPVVDAADIANWLDDVLAGLALGAVHLVGLSYGGWLALNQARHSADRLSSVTAVDPPGVFGAARIGPMLAMVPDALRAKFAKSDAALQRLLARLNNGVAPPEPVRDLAIAGLRSFTPEQPRPKRFTEADLRAIATPTLLLLCGASPVTRAPRAAERARRLIPNVDVEVVADAGHMLPVEHTTDFTNRLLAFVDALDQLERVDPDLRP
jgi:pimeloyl-ACP methyl ester carboxylesterase